MNKFIYIILLSSLLCNCNIVTKLSVGLSLKHHKITDEKIIKFAKVHFPKSANIGKLDSNYFTSLFNPLKDSLNTLTRKKFNNYIGQPLNCMFFDSLNNLKAAYAICDAELKNFRLTWDYYLKKPERKNNFNINVKFQFFEIQKHFILLDSIPINKNKNNVILIWSKIGGKQKKYFFNEFHNYLKDKNYNVFIMNCDEAFNVVDIGK
jgi:hypothetical protein